MFYLACGVCELMLYVSLQIHSGKTFSTGQVHDTIFPDHLFLVDGFPNEPLGYMCNLEFSF